MKFAYWSLCLISLSLFSGCASKVITYNAAGQMTGSCIAQASFLFQTKAKCYGYSTTEGLRFSPPQKISAFTATVNPQPYMASNTTIPNQITPNNTHVQLQDLPKAAQITISLEKTALIDLPLQQRIRLFNETPTLD